MEVVKTTRTCPSCPTSGSATNRVACRPPHESIWPAIELGFAGETGSITLTASGETSKLTFGLDGVARVSSARHFTSRPEVDVALVGRFQGERTLKLVFDTLADIDSGSLTLTLDASANALTIDVFERTFIHGHLLFEGTRERIGMP